MDIGAASASEEMYLKKLGRHIFQEDYVKAGIMEEVTVGQFDSY